MIRCVGKPRPGDVGVKWAQQILVTKTEFHRCHSSSQTPSQSYTIGLWNKLFTNLEKCFPCVLFYFSCHDNVSVNRYTINDRNLGRLLTQISTNYNTDVQLWQVGNGFSATYCQFAVKNTMIYVWLLSLVAPCLLDWRAIKLFLLKEEIMKYNNTKFWKKYVSPTGLVDGAFFQPNTRCWCWWNAQEASTGNSKKQHWMDQEQWEWNQSMVGERCFLVVLYRGTVWHIYCTC